MYRFHPTIERHLYELIDALDDVLALPELHCFDREQLFETSAETLAKARVVRDYVVEQIAQTTQRQQR